MRFHVHIGLKTELLRVLRASLRHLFLSADNGDARAFFKIMLIEVGFFVQLILVGNEEGLLGYMAQYLASGTRPHIILRISYSPCTRGCLCSYRSPDLIQRTRANILTFQLRMP